MINFENFLKVQDTMYRGNYTAFAQYQYGVRVQIDIYLYQTMICTIDLINRAFSMENNYWMTSTTINAISELSNCLQELGYCYTQLTWTGNLPSAINILVPAITYREEKKMINTIKHTALTCIHVGKSNKKLKSIPIDEIFLSTSNKPLSLQKQQIRGCYMRGRNVQQIAQYVTDHDAIEFTLHFTNEDAPDLYALWIYKNTMYIFKFRIRKTAYHKDFSSCNATYTAIEMYECTNSELLNLARMIGLSNTAYDLFIEHRSDFKLIS